MGRTFLVECYWPGVTDADLLDTARRARAAAHELSRVQTGFRYLDSLRLVEDEVTFHRFASESADMVRQASERAGLNSERILEYVTTGEDPPCGYRAPSATAQSTQDRSES